ncbi:MAG: hypothetical protein DWI09_00055 [Planctomycetota bacterium]|nr:MAG: hypothetical protein DWI09_00055 [Planctomycetota bacterium]
MQGRPLKSRMVDNLSPMAVRHEKTDGKTHGKTDAGNKAPKKTPLVWNHGAVWLQTSGAIQMP